VWEVQYLCSYLLSLLVSLVSRYFLNHQNVMVIFVLNLKIYEQENHSPLYTTTKLLRIFWKMKSQWGMKNNLEIFLEKSSDKIGGECWKARTKFSFFSFRSHHFLARCWRKPLFMATISISYKYCPPDGCWKYFWWLPVW
jgi:hypothetical protein